MNMGKMYANFSRQLNKMSLRENSQEFSWQSIKDIEMDCFADARKDREPKAHKDRQ